MVPDVAGECLERAAGKPHGSVGVPASPSAVDEAEHPVQFVEQTVVHARVGKVVEQLGKSGEAVAARSALPGALFGEVADDVCGMGEAALGRWAARG